jgi:hypothetical protein
MALTKAILEKQNRDLKTRLDNLKVKLEMAERGQARDEVILVLQSEIKTLALENEGLKAEMAHLSAELEKEKDRADKLAAMMKKDSSNSSKPPSNDGFKKARATSTKTASGKKPGGQPGHKGRTLEPFAEPTDTIDKMPAESCRCCGGKVSPAGGFVPKQAADIQITVTVTEERSHSGRCENCGTMHEGEFSGDFINPVQYGPGVKTVVSALNAYANVTVGKTSEFLGGLTGGRINISDGTVINILDKSARELEETVESIRLMLINGKFLNADETGCRVNGKLDWFQIFSNDECTLFGHNKKRGELGIEGFGLLLLFTGILVHDHLVSYYKDGYRMTHAECNAHILRYLKAVTEIFTHGWAADMTALLIEAYRLKKECMKKGDVSLEERELERIKTSYMEIINKGWGEYKAATEGKENITYYDEERRLLARLEKYMEQHLKFITDFDAPFDNNGAERQARFVKSKVKVSGGFRSDKGADNYARIASVISTIKKQGMNVFNSFESVFKGNKLVFKIPPDNSG